MLFSLSHLDTHLLTISHTHNFTHSQLHIHTYSHTFIFFIFLFKFIFPLPLLLFYISIKMNFINPYSPSNRKIDDKMDHKGRFFDTRENLKRTMYEMSKTLLITRLCCSCDKMIAFTCENPICDAYLGGVWNESLKCYQITNIVRFHRCNLNMDVQVNCILNFIANSPSNNNIGKITSSLLINNYSVGFYEVFCLYQTRLLYPNYPFGSSDGSGNVGDGSGEGELKKYCMERFCKEFLELNPQCTTSITPSSFFYHITNANDIFRPVRTIKIIETSFGHMICGCHFCHKELPVVTSTLFTQGVSKEESLDLFLKNSLREDPDLTFLIPFDEFLISRFKSNQFTNFFISTRSLIHYLCKKDPKYDPVTLFNTINYGKGKNIGDISLHIPCSMNNWIRMEQNSVNAYDDDNNNNLDACDNNNLEADADDNNNTNSHNTTTSHHRHNTTTSNHSHNNIIHAYFLNNIFLSEIDFISEQLLYLDFFDCINLFLYLFNIDLEGRKPVYSEEFLSSKANEIISANLQNCEGAGSGDYDLKEGRCDCLKFQEFQIPCVHAINGLILNKGGIEEKENTSNTTTNKNTNGSSIEISDPCFYVSKHYQRFQIKRIDSVIPPVNIGIGYYKNLSRDVKLKIFRREHKY